MGVNFNISATDMRLHLKPHDVFPRSNLGPGCQPALWRVRDIMIVEKQVIDPLVSCLKLPCWFPASFGLFEMGR